MCCTGKTGIDLDIAVLPVPKVQRSVLHQGKKVLVVEDAACKAGEREIIRDFWYEFAPGEHIGIVGPNGAGAPSLTPHA